MMLYVLNTVFNLLSAALCSYGDVRLSIDGHEPETYELVGDELAIGRVEVCNGTSYKTVCRNVWGNEEASVVCSQLGFSEFGESIYSCGTAGTT